MSQLKFGVSQALTRKEDDALLRGAGRYVSDHLPAGTLRHASIAASAPKPGECAVGWLTHYTIGIGLALGLVLLTAGDWLASPTLIPALLYGVGTVVFPFFILQPSLGFGVASSKAPSPARARLKSLATHTVFGLGLYVCALAISGMLP